MDNFQEIARCIMESGGGLQVNDPEELFIQAKSLLENESVRNDLGEKAFQIIARNQGTTRKAMEAIGKFLMPAAQ
jgi:3-deoxy-D-manno-octulosonic-acid transferase